MLLNQHPVLRHQSRGFSLVEMAIVLAIVALLLGSLLPSISSQMDIQHLKEARKQMEDIRSALIGFAISNGRLPCPDTDATPDGNENIGPPSTSNDYPVTGQSAQVYLCSAQIGKLPYNQLGINPTDIYNGPFIYRVTSAFSEKDVVYSGLNLTLPVLTTNFFKLSSVGDLRVCNTKACTAPRLIDDAVAVVVSSGKNWARVTEYSADEIENTDNNKDFVSRDPAPDFDDIVVWISPSTLFNRMVAAGKLP